MLSSNNIVLLNDRTMRLLAFNQFIFIIQSGMHEYPAVVVFIFLTLNNALCSICVSAVYRTWYFYQLDFFFESKPFTIPTDLFIINLVLAMNLPCKLHMDAKLRDFGTGKKTSSLLFIVIMKIYLNSYREIQWNSFSRNLLLIFENKMEFSAQMCCSLWQKESLLKLTDVNWSALATNVWSFPKLFDQTKNSSDNIEYWDLIWFWLHKHFTESTFYMGYSMQYADLYQLTIWKEKKHHRFNLVLNKHLIAN